MRIYNSDGSEPEMCGNGIRCLARFVSDIDGAAPRAYRVDTLAGLIQPTLLADGQVRVDMGEPVLRGPDVPTTLPPTQGEAVVQGPLAVAGREWLMTCVSMGNPHAITYGTADGQGIQVRSAAGRGGGGGPAAWRGRGWGGAVRSMAGRERPRQ